MNDYFLRIILVSDATFGRGDGVAGLVDQEVECDEVGLPIIHGRTLKGLLVDSCAEVLYGLSKAYGSDSGQVTALERDAEWLFGSPGSLLRDTGKLHIGTGRIPDPIASYFRSQVISGVLSVDEVRSAMTAIRRQTAMDEHDVPLDGSLRSQRVVIRNTEFISSLGFSGDPENRLRLLAACAAGVQRGGSGRTRGRGRLAVSLEPVTSFAELFIGAPR